MNGFREIDVLNLKESNAFKLIGKDWMLITAGDEKNLNTMTASWGMLGVLWQKNVSCIFVRPQRYTFKFLENSDYYSLCFFDDKYKKVLSYCGTHSGKDTDKISATGLNVALDKAPYFKEAKLVLICKKIYTDCIDPAGFVETALENEYESHDYHKVFVGEVVKCLERE